MLSRMPSSLSEPIFATVNATEMAICRIISIERQAAGLKMHKYHQILCNIGWASA